MNITKYLDTLIYSLLLILGLSILGYSYYTSREVSKVIKLKATKVYCPHLDKWK